MKEITTIPQLIEEFQHNPPICPKCGGIVQFLGYETNALSKANYFHSLSLSLEFECLQCETKYRAYFTIVPNENSGEMVWIKDYIETDQDNFNL